MLCAFDLARPTMTTRADERHDLFAESYFFHFFSSTLALHVALNLSAPMCARLTRFIHIDARPLRQWRRKMQWGPRVQKSTTLRHIKGRLQCRYMKYLKERLTHGETHRNEWLTLNYLSLVRISYLTVMKRAPCVPILRRTSSAYASTQRPSYTHSHLGTVAL